MGMKLFSELYQQFFEEGELNTSRIQYAVVNGRGGYFQNVKRIEEFSPQTLVFSGRTGGVQIEGEQLSLGRYFGGDVTVYGNIFSVSALPAPPKKKIAEGGKK